MTAPADLEFAAAVERLVDATLLAAGIPTRDAVAMVYGSGEWADRTGALIAAAVSRRPGRADRRRAVDAVGQVVGKSVSDEVIAAVRLIRAMADQVAEATGMPADEVLRNAVLGARGDLDG
jgi:hypothetical protein